MDIVFLVIALAFFAFFTWRVFRIVRGLRQYGSLRLWLSVRASRRIKGKRVFSPYVADGVIYFGSDDGKLFAVDIAERQLKWQWQAPARMTAAPNVAGDTVYICAWDGAMHAIDTTSGEEKWRFKTRGLTLGTPAVHGDAAYVGSTDFHLYAVDIANGQEKWRFNTGNQIQQDHYPMHDGKIFVGSWHALMYALNIADGEKIWRSSELDGRVTCVPAIVEERVFFSDWHDKLYALGLDDGQEIWKFEPDETYEGKNHFFENYVAVHDDTIFYTPQTDGNLYGVDRHTGEKNWFMEFEGSVSLDSVNHGALVFITERMPAEGESRPAYLRAVDLAEKEIRWSSENIPGAGKPFVADGVAYFGSTAGIIYGYDVESGQEVWRFERP